MEVKNIEREILGRIDPSELNVNFLLSSKGQFGPLYSLKCVDREYVLKVIDK